MKSTINQFIEVFGQHSGPHVATKSTFDTALTPKDGAAKKQ